MLKIKGFQTLTLLDYPGRIAATIFTEGCNFCCPFCHNASLVCEETSDEYFSEEHVLSHLKKLKGRLSGLCITGGEPLLHKELSDFIKKVKALGYFVKLDTNGSFPFALEKLLKDQLVDYVAMDIKNCKEKYALTSGFSKNQNFNSIMENIEKSIHLLRSGNVPFEFRTTVVKEFHSVEDIQSMGQWLSGSDVFFLQAFVDSGNTIAPGLTACTKEEMAERCSVLKRFIPKVCIRGI
jgi:pyruvate formate lyase activating enzyme